MADSVFERVRELIREGRAHRRLGRCPRCRTVVRADDDRTRDHLGRWCHRECARR